MASRSTWSSSCSAWRRRSPRTGSWSSPSAPADGCPPRSSATTVAVGAYGAVLALAGATLLVPGPDLDDLEQRLTAGSTVTSAHGDAGSTGQPARGPGGAGPLDGRPGTGDDDDATATTLAPLPPPRIGVFGDSTAVRTGSGLTDYGERSGQLHVVVNAARVGCGVDQLGERRFLGETF